MTTSESLAYVIYTSGSTGRPKGVALEHRSAVALIAWGRSIFGPRELSGVLASTSICFDLSVFELFVPLACGGKVILAENALTLPDLPAADEVTLINTVPSIMGELLRLGSLPPSVVTVNLAGEPLSAELVRRVCEAGSVEKVFDLYGPSEDTTYSTLALRSPEGPATIGRPIANTQAYVLDSHGQMLPVGVPGELHLGGDGLARGYWNRAELTAERFVPDPFGDRPGARLYKTGDLVRWLPAGNLEFLGRLDHQVKIRGFRIELGEVETVLSEHAGVRQVVVSAREDRPGQRRLVAYVVGDGEAAPAVEQLRSFLQARLPDHMIPSVFVPIETLPLLPSGKVDRRSLPSAESTRPHLRKEYVAPRNEAEERLGEIWRDVLGLDRVGVHDNFFELGGDSVLIVQMVSRANARGLHCTLLQLFQNQTIAELAAVLQTPRC